MISEHMWLTIIIRILVSVLIFTLLLLFPHYIKQNMEKYQTRRNVNLFLLGYARWYFMALFQAIRSIGKKNEDNDVRIDEFILVFAGIVALAVILSLIPDDYISGIGVEITGAVMATWTFISYWSIRDVLQSPSDSEPIKETATLVEGTDHANE